MAAYGIVRKSPYIAVTDENGQFELKNVPAGVPLEFRIWQEKSRFLGEAEITGTFDKFKGWLNLQLTPDETRGARVYRSRQAIRRKLTKRQDNGVFPGETAVRRELC